MGGGSTFLPTGRYTWAILRAFRGKISNEGQVLWGIVTFEAIMPLLLQWFLQVPLQLLPAAASDIYIGGVHFSRPEIDSLANNIVIEPF